MENENKDQSLLSEFLQSIEKIPTQIIDALLRVTEDEDERNVINSFAPAFTNQFNELSLFASEKSRVATKQGLFQAEEFLKISSGNMLTENLKIALPSIGSIIGKMGIAGIIQEIKKILKKLLELFSIKLPPWLDALIVLIDEILNHLLGGESIKLRNTLHQMEVNFQTELTQLAKLEKAGFSKFQNDDDDE